MVMLTFVLRSNLSLSFPWCFCSYLSISRVDLFIKGHLEGTKEGSRPVARSGTHCAFPGAVEAKYKIIPGNSSVLREQMVV